MSSLINFSGIASGIDSSALIKALLDQERAVRIDPFEAKALTLKETNDAFSELKDLLSALSTAAGKFRPVNGGILGKSAISSDESITSASATNGASNGTYSLTVNSLAQNGVYTFSDSYGSLDAVIDSGINDGTADADRTLTYTIGTGASQETVDVVLTSSTTVNDLVTSFNTTSTKAVMSAVNVGTSATPDYRLVVTSLEEGTEDGAIATSRGVELTGQGIFDDTTATKQLATDADFDISGVGTGITRGSNSITDVITGITLNLVDTGSVTLSISDDSASTTSLMQDFVDAYNEVVNYISENDIVTRDESSSEVQNIFGTLANTSLDNSILSSLRSALSGAGTSGRTVNILADLGITTNRDGTLDFDSDKFSEALSDDSTGVGIITSNLGEDLAAIDGTIAQFVRFNGLIDGATQANVAAIDQINKRITEAEASLASREQSLIKQYSRLESLIGQLNSQQNSLSSILPG